mgnify:CR=1 FL=1
MQPSQRVVTATATQSGSVATTVSGQHSGTGWTAQAERSATAAAQATGGSAGVYAGSGAGATASDSGSVTLTLASNTVLDAGTGDLSLLALSTPSADAYALGVSIGRGVGMGVSVALSEVDTNVQVLANGPLSLSGKNMLVNAVLGHGDSSVTAKAVAGGGGLLLGAQGAGATASNQGTAAVTFSNGATLAATGDVAIMANDAMRMNSESTGVGVGFVGAGVAVAMTESNSTVSSNASGLAGRVQGSLTVSARGDELIDADAVAGSGGVVAGAGADARIDHVQNVSATLSSSGSGLLVDGLTAVTAERKVRFDTQASTINASAFGGSGAVTVASLTGSATAKLGNNAKLTGAQLQILATNDVERTDLTAINVQGGGGGVTALVLWGTLTEGGFLLDPKNPTFLGSYFIRGLIFFIFLYGLVAGLAYGLGARTIRSDNDVVRGMDASMVSQMKAMEEENRRLKRMYADLSMQNDLLKEALGKK